jgi:protein-S-isoprenylcysteine O-methyltransferase Ste14
MGLALRQLAREGGGGTPAPWDPPRRFVVAGVYRHVRNPMISGVIAALYAEALLLQSLPLLAWAVLFMLANLAYIPLVEEPGLEKRFGADYRRYKANVPRWIPRLRAWTPPGPGQEP